MICHHCTAGTNSIPASPSRMTLSHRQSSLMLRMRALLPFMMLWGFAHAIEMECNADGECSGGVPHDDDSCGLYIAESTIPLNGLGVFLGTNANSGNVIDTVSDILVHDMEENRQIYEYLFNKTLPRWALSDATWDYGAKNEADFVAIVSPGIGSLANAHLGLVNVEKVPCSSYNDAPRSNPLVGSTSPYHECAFRMTQDAAAGTELFMSPALRNFADSPLSAGLRVDPSFQETWQKMSFGLSTMLSAELWESAGKGDVVEPKDIPTLPTQRPVSWLKENGVCIDHIRVDTKAEDPLDRGAFSKKNFKANSVVTTSPVRVLSRSHLDITILDKNSQPKKEIMWQGKQLLLNSCYGDPSSSLLLFPLDSRVQIMSNPKDGQTANVGIRWSSRLPQQKALFELSPDKLLMEAKADGLAFDFYALSDIAAGDELLLDFGEAWEKAWSDHVRSWAPDQIVHSKDYVSAPDYAIQCKETVALTNDHSCMMNIPTWIRLSCSTHSLESAEADLKAIKLETTTTTTCSVLNVDSNGLYTVRVEDHATAGEAVVVEGVSLDAITFTNLPYTSNQFLRSSFRHEIGIPKGVIPEAWRDAQDAPESECGLYMAESAIPNSGLGMYTAKEIPKDSRIFYGDVVVQVEDTYLNRKLRYRSQGIRKFNEPEWLLHNYYWDPTNAMAEFDAREIETIIPGLGMLANSHTGLVNSQHKSPRRFEDLNRFLDPGAGASSTYHDVHFDALKKIEAGAELYVGYGDDWFADRAGLGEIPLSFDFDVADKGVKMLSVISASIRDESTKSTLVLDALDLFIQVSRPSQRLVNAFPRNLTVYEEAIERGTADLTVPNRVRSKEWLQANGGCLDNIRPGKSNIKQAGRGAFATRNLKKGQVVAPMPVVHIRRHHMEIYDSTDYRNFEAETWRDSTQQLINYCFSHPESSLLLYAYAPVVNYINHSFKEPNAELRWSSFPNHQRSWLDRTPNDLDQEDHAGLIMELVATRDIMAGEEVLINYGSSWEDAWNAFAKSWTPNPEDQHYVSTASLNRELAWIQLTSETSEYPFVNAFDILTGCFVKLSEKVKGPREQMPLYNWKGADDLLDTGDYLKRCEIIEIEKHPVHPRQEVFDRHGSIKPVEVKYTVVVHIDEERRAKVINVPRKAIMFFDEMYMSDNFKRGSFRHEMYLPDHMVPRAWRDLKN